MDGQKMISQSVGILEISCFPHVTTPSARQRLTQRLAFSEGAAGGVERYLSLQIPRQLLADVHFELERCLAESSVHQNVVRSLHSKVDRIERQHFGHLLLSFHLHLQDNESQVL